MAPLFCRKDKKWWLNGGCGIKKGLRKCQRWKFGRLCLYETFWVCLYEYFTDLTIMISEIRKVIANMKPDHSSALP